MSRQPILKRVVAVGALVPATHCASAQCLPRPECQDATLISSHDATSLCYERIVPTQSGTITSVCVSAVFWDFMQNGVECPHTFGVWRLRIYEDNAGFPGNEIASFVYDNVTPIRTMGFDSVQSGETFINLPVWDTEFSGFIGVPVTSGNGYHVNIAYEDTCRFLWIFGEPGDGTAFRDLANDGVTASDAINVDFNICFVLAPTPCSPADITTTGAGPGDPGFGVPDGAVTTTDLNFFVNAWVALDASVADVTTTGAGPGDPGFGVPDGNVTTTDLNYYVNLWVAGCP